MVNFKVAGSAVFVPVNDALRPSLCTLLIFQIELDTGLLVFISS